MVICTIIVHYEHTWNPCGHLIQAASQKYMLLSVSPFLFLSCTHKPHIYLKVIGPPRNEADDYAPEDCGNDCGVLSNKSGPVTLDSM